MTPPTPHDDHDRCRSLGLWYKQVGQATEWSDNVTSHPLSWLLQGRQAVEGNARPQPGTLTEPVHSTTERQQHSEKAGTTTPKPASSTLRRNRTCNHDGSFPTMAEPTMGSLVLMRFPRPGRETNRGHSMYRLDPQNTNHNFEDDPIFVLRRGGKEPFDECVCFWESGSAVLCSTPAFAGT